MPVVSITWKKWGGATFDALAQPLDHGQGENGDTLTESEIEVSHDGSNQITGCKFYLAEYSASYTGAATASADLAEMLAWGDGGTANAFGGLLVHMGRTGSYATSWPTQGTKTESEADTFRTGVGDSAANGISLPTTMSSGMSSAGVLPAAMGTWPAFKARVQIPTDEDTAGIRQFDQKLRYTYTS